MKTNYNLKKEVLENGCCKSLKKLSLSKWKISQLESEYNFILNGINAFGEKAFSYTELKAVGEKLEKSRYFYNLALKELSIYSDSYIKEAEKVNYATYKRNTRLQQKALDIIKSNSAIFLTLTFNDVVFSKMSKETRRKNITRFLKNTCKCYIANIDYGSKNDREHYHALVIPEGDIIDNKKYKKMFYDSAINFERIVISNKKNHDIESTSKKVSKYVSKLTNHAIKETTQGCRIIYSKN